MNVLFLNQASLCVLYLFVFLKSKIPFMKKFTLLNRFMLFILQLAVHKTMDQKFKMNWDQYIYMKL